MIAAIEVAITVALWILLGAVCAPLIGEIIHIFNPGDEP